MNSFQKHAEREREKKRFITVCVAMPHAKSKNRTQDFQTRSKHCTPMNYDDVSLSI